MSFLGNVDPVLVAFIVAFVVLVIGLYLLIRRAVTSFTEGLRQGRQ